MKKLLVAVVVGVFFATGAVASNPVQLSITPDIALVDQNERIEGVSLGIWSENPQTALTLGFVNGSTGQSSGFSYAFLGNYSENYTGVQFGIANYTSGDYVGWQAGTVNFVEGDMHGLQSGAFNYARNLNGGLQLGWVNYAEMVEAGLQIGLVNVIPRNEWFTEMPQELAPGFVVVNWRF